MINLNQKGLTLVELIAVIAIIGIIIVLVATNVFRTQAGIQERMFCTQVTAIEQGAIRWGENNRPQLANICASPGQGCTSVVPLNSSREQIFGAVPQTNNNLVTLRYLVDSGYLDPDNASNDIIDPRTNDSMNMNLPVTVFVRNNRISAVFQYGLEACNQ